MCLDGFGACLVTVASHVSVLCVCSVLRYLGEDIWVVCLYVVVCVGCSA